METSKGDIVEALLRLEREKRTGVLEFRAAEVTTRVFVDRGIPVFAEAGVVGETLGHILVRERVITDAQFAAVVRRMTDAIVSNENLRFGEVLVELAILTQEQLGSALATQVEKKILGCVHRGEGESSFDASSERVAEVPHHAIPIRALLVDAAQVMPQARMEKLLAFGRETFPRLTHGPAQIAREFELEDAELAALSLFDGTRTTQSIVTSATGVDAGALLAALVLGEHVELLDHRAEKTVTAAATSITATGRRRALRAKLAARDKAKGAMERFMREREAPLPKPRNERESTLFAEDAFQAGKRLFAQDKLDEARTKLKLAVERAPDVALYKLYSDFAESRAHSGFADRATTKRLAIRIAKEDASCAFAFYVLGYVAIDEGASDSAKRFFRQAFKLDSDLVDAGRQARLIDLRSDDMNALKTSTPFREIVPTLLKRTAPSLPDVDAPQIVMPPKAGTPERASPAEKRTMVLAGLLAFVVVVAVAVFVWTSRR